MKIKFGKKAKAEKTPAAPKKKTKILEYYYMTPEQTNAKEMTTFIKSVDEEKLFLNSSNVLPISLNVFCFITSLVGLKLR